MKSLQVMAAVAFAMAVAPTMALADGCRTAQNVVVQEVAPAPVVQYVQPQVVQRVVVQPQVVQYVQQPQRVIVQQQAVYSHSQAFVQPQRVIVQQGFNGRGRQNFNAGGGALGNVFESILSPQGILTIGGAAGGAAIAGPAGAIGGAAIGAAIGNVLGNGLRR